MSRWQEPTTVEQARRYAWDADDWQEGIDHCLAMIAAEPGTTALDYGCGPGRLTFALRDRGVDALGYDPNRPMLADGDQFTADRADLDHLRFDLVFSVLVFQHLTPEVQADTFADMASLVAPGGRLVVQVVHSGDTGPLSHPTPVGSAFGWVVDAGLTFYSATYDADYPTWVWVHAR